MGNISSILGYDYYLPAPIQTPIAKPARDQFIQAMLDAGLIEPFNLTDDGILRRFGKNKTSWYIAFNNFEGGAFGDWKIGLSNNFRADIGRQYTAKETTEYSTRMAEAKALYEVKLKRAQSLAANTVSTIWNNAAEAISHAYLTNKGVQSHGLKLTGDGRLIIPARDNEGNIHTLQYIDDDGNKLLHSGGAKHGYYHAIGKPDSIIFMSEGYSTAASIYEATERYTVCAIDAGNLLPVALALRAKYPAAQIILCADNDLSGVGLTLATKAANAVAGRVVMPPNTGDFNDLHQSAGIGAVVRLLNNKRYKLLGTNEINAMPPIDWCIKHVLPSRGVAAIYGPSGSGKSFLTLDACLAIAEGQPYWFGYRVKQCPVVYVALEGQEGYRLRIEAWKVKNSRDIPANFHFIMQSFKLNDERDVLDLLDVIPHGAIVVIDTTAKASHDVDENSGKDMSKILDAAQHIADSVNGLVWLVAHTGKDATKGLRGWSGVVGALDASIETTGDRKSLTKNWTSDKVKDGLTGEGFDFNLEIIELGTDTDGDPVTSCVIANDGVKSKAKTKTKPLSESNKLGLEAFEIAAQNGYNDGLELKAWRDSFYPLHDGDANSKRQAFNRVKTSLVELGYLIQEGEVFKYTDIVNNSVLNMLSVTSVT